MKSCLSRAHLALLPMAFTALLCYLGATLWSIRISLSSSRTFPVHDFVGLAQYRRLFSEQRWLHSLANLGVYGAPFLLASPLLGFLVAVVVARGRVRPRGFWFGVLYTSLPSFIAPR